MDDLSLSIRPPWLHRAVGRADELERRLKYIESVNETSRLYWINGQACGTTSTCYLEISAAMGFPETFGANLNALYDSLCDGDLLSGNPILLVVRSAGKFLSSESSNTLNDFLDTLRSVAANWSRGLGWPWNTGPTPFHVYFLFESISDSHRFEDIDLIY